MAKLPIIPKKQFDVKSKYLPKGKLTLIPFTVGQEDILLQVKDAEDDKEKVDAIKQIVGECIQTKDVDVDTLPMFVIEEIFLRLRQNSIGELIDQMYQCTNIPEGGEIPCGNKMPIQIDLREFKMTEPEGHTNVITLADPIGIKFKYPSIETISNAETTDEVDTILGCIDAIFDDENVYPAADSSKEELLEFWNQLTLMQKKDVFEKFFYSMPHMHYKKDLVCPQCGYKHEIEFNNVQEVFQ